MQLHEAWSTLGIEVTDDRRLIRDAYLGGVRVAHPDVSARPDANERTAALRDAYETILRAVEGGAPLVDPPPVGSPPFDAAPAPPSPSHRRRRFRADPSGPPPGPRPGPHDEPIAVVWVSDDTVGIEAPADEAFPFLIEACHEIGDVTFLDRRAGLLQVTVGFIGEPVCYLVMSLQGRASGMTEVFCSIDSIEAAPPPPIAAVTRLLVDTLRGLVW